MTVADLRDCLFEIKNQNQEICLEDLCRIIGLYERCKDIDAKVDQLFNENVNPSFIAGWQKEKSDTMFLIRNYKSQ